jgi:NAD(P)-dependent dehydrogenase (short-subunit alcohol dehydrogenase family)
MKALLNKVALITGAGSGIGKTIAQLFAREGAKVILADIHQQNIEAVQKDISRQHGISSCYAADIANSSDANLLINYTTETFGGLDILVNNAGVMDSFTPVHEVDDELWAKVMGVNLNGPFYLSRAAVKLFLKQGSGDIINIASIGGLFGGRAGAAYTASKHGLVGLTKNIAYQYGLSGIRCNAIAPGGVNTNITQGMEVNHFGFDRMNAGTATMPPAAEPINIAEIALFLASDKSGYLNGTVITADGGWTAY